jgi:hypothetical protein
MCGPTSVAIGRMYELARRAIASLNVAGIGCDLA